MADDFVVVSDEVIVDNGQLVRVSVVELTGLTGEPGKILFEPEVLNIESVPDIGCTVNECIIDGNLLGDFRVTFRIVPGDTYEVTAVDHLDRVWKKYVFS